MKIFKASKRTRKLVKSLNKKYLKLNLGDIKFYEYEPEEGDYRVAWSNPSKKIVFLDPSALPSDPAYAAFIIAHEIAHVRLMHKGKRTLPEQESAASSCAQFLLVHKVGTKKAKVLAERWARDWLKLTKTRKALVAKRTSKDEIAAVAAGMQASPMPPEGSSTQVPHESLAAPAPTEEPGQQQ